MPLDIPRIRLYNRAVARLLGHDYHHPSPHTMAASTPLSSAKGSHRPKVLVLTGPTAVGKTRVSLALAEALNGEIISADSVQVYRGLDVGSDKIPVNERRGIPHHLIDVLSPQKEFSAGYFFHHARQATEEVLSRGRTPIVVGGTGFYLRWYVLGRPSTPAATRESEAAAAAALQQHWSAAETSAGRELTESEKWEAAVQFVEGLGDHQSAERLRGEPGNVYRLNRIVDILLQSPGKTLADLDLDASAPGDYDFRCFFLTRPRMELYRRIDARVEDIIQSGLLKETGRELWSRGLTAGTNCATRAIGYRQALEFLQEGWEKVKDMGNSAADETIGGSIVANGDDVFRAADVDLLVRKIQAASRKLCHRQVSWFRDEPHFRWIDATRSEDEVVAEVLSRFSEAQHVGGGSNGGQLSKEEQRDMRRYIAKVEKLVGGSDAMVKALEEAHEALSMGKPLPHGHGTTAKRSLETNECL